MNAEQASKRVMRTPTPLNLGEGRCCWGDERWPQQVRRGNGDGMDAHGDGVQHGKPDGAEGRDLRPDAREGQAGPDRVAERLGVLLKLDNAGGGKEPQFKDNVARRRVRRVA